MRKTLALLGLLSISLTTFAQTHHEFDAEIQSQKEFLVRKIESASGVRLSSADTKIIEDGLRYEYEPRMKKMSSNGKQYRPIFCVGGQLSAGMHAAGSLCTLSNGKIYNLLGIGLGAQVGVSFNVQMGLFISEPGASMADSYWAAGASAGAMVGGVTANGMISRSGKQIYLAGVLLTFFDVGASGQWVEVTESLKTNDVRELQLEKERLEKENRELRAKKTS